MRIEDFSVKDNSMLEIQRLRKNLEAVEKATDILWESDCMNFSNEIEALSKKEQEIYLALNKLETKQMYTSGEKVTRKNAKNYGL
jgi:hypothetical protein